MARTALAPQAVSRAGLNLVLTAANVDGHSIVNDGKTVLLVENGAGAPINVTVQTPGTVDGLAIADLVVAVPNGESRYIGPFPRSIYNQAADGAVYVDFSAVTTITCAALQVVPA